ncbi:L,D-transpeptidase family protein [Bradyrhizobium sp. TZ2]
MPCAAQVQKHLRSSKLASLTEWDYVPGLFKYELALIRSVGTRMTSRCVNPKCKQARLRPAHVAVAGLAALIAAGDHAAARSGSSERLIESIESRSAGEPIMAIVSLRNQRITVYDAKGWILRAPVSSGTKGRETPAGIFSVIQKVEDHYSNLYDDAYMPHMQRITWSGIALHGGVLPGYPASHGCIRLPFDFAARLFDATAMGIRVIVAPTDVAPVELAHPVLFQPKPGAAALAASRAADAQEAAGKAAKVRLAAGTASREATRATVPVRAAENLMLRAEVQLAAAEAALGSAKSAEAKEQAEGAKAQAATRLAELQVQWEAAKAGLQLKLDAVTSAREAAAAAEIARVTAAEAARQVARELEPASVLISRKTQRLYVRQAFEPVFESPVTIADPDRAIGTHVFTAIERTTDDTNLRWSVVSLGDGGPPIGTVEPQGRARGSTRGSGGRDVEPVPTDPDSAKAALDRIVIPQDALDRLVGIAPRSSLIVTDEALSSETGKGTEFVVLLSGEPQGGIKKRRRSPGTEFRYARPRSLPFWRSPFGSGFSSW